MVSERIIMLFTKEEKNEIKETLASALSVEKEVRQVIVFGSFLSDSNPHDLDIAVFQDSNEKYPQTCHALQKGYTINLMPHSG